VPLFASSIKRLPSALAVPDLCACRVSDRAATTTATLLARGHTPSLLPDVYDESIQAACILLPVLSLLITLGRRSWLRFTGSNATEAGGRTGADVEGGDTGELMRASSKGSMTQLQANKKEEEEIKLRAAQKANGS